MRVTAAGTKSGKPRRITYDLLDLYNKEIQATSMSRTTGIPCAIVARMLASGRIKQPGVNAPEKLAAIPNFVTDLLQQHQQRNIQYRIS